MFKVTAQGIAPAEFYPEPMKNDADINNPSHRYTQVMMDPGPCANLSDVPNMRLLPRLNINTAKIFESSTKLFC